MTAAITHSVEPAGPVEPVEADAGKQTPLEEAEALVEQLSLQDAFKRFQQRRQVRSASTSVAVQWRAKVGGNAVGETSEKRARGRRSARMQHVRRRRRRANGRRRSSSGSFASGSWRKRRAT
jgi:hypothetical protein